ncbi:MAG: ribose-phosphate pyrophosphokinase [Chloroflexi bacterium 13_1_40CM_4_68_4]|nr:MAG: ribose-phosphate pyrophosphokinase [Chloroflexi bacterium 13_1_40CM_4_68_4]
MARYAGLSVYTGNAHEAFARAICEYLEIPLGDAEVTKFANDNIFAKYNENVRERDVFLVQSLTRSARGMGVSDAIMELLIMIDAARRASAGRITAVIPFYAYGRSDKKDQPRVPITARLLADLIEVAGADRVLTMDLHQAQIQGFFTVPVDELTGFRMLREYFRDLLKRGSWVVVAPDLGFANEARKLFAEPLGLPLALVQKRHLGNTGETEAMVLIGEVHGRKAIIVDDEIDMGGTVLNAVDLLLEQGATEVHAAVAHATLSRDAAEKLEASRLKALVTTDSVPIPPEKRRDKIEVITVAPLFGEAIRRIHEGESVGALFDSTSVQLPLRIS